MRPNSERSTGQLQAPPAAAISVPIKLSVRFANLPPHIGLTATGRCR